MSEGGALLLMDHATESTTFPWDNNHNSWPNLSNSDNSSGGGGGGGRGNQEKSGCKKKKEGSSGAAGKEPQSNNKKRSRGGGVSKNNGVNNDNKANMTSSGDHHLMNDSSNNNNNNNNSKEGKGGSSTGGGCGGESDHEIHIWTERERRKKMRNMFANLHALLPQLPPKADKSTIVDEAVNYIRTLQQTLHKLQKQKLEKLQGATISSTTTPTPTPTTSTTFNNLCDRTSMINIINPQQKAALVLYDNNNNVALSREAFLADQGSCNDLVSMGNSSNNNNNNNKNSISQVPSHVLAPVIFQTWTSSNVVLNICGDQAHISVCSPKKPGLFTSICYVLEKHNITLVSAQISSDLATNRNMYMIHAHATSSTAGSSANSDQFLEGFNSVEEVFKQAVGEIMFWVSS